MRGIEGIYEGPGFHWVGDGFYVTQVLPGPHNLTEKTSPFLLMDYHAPYHYDPTDTPRGVGVHPHRGFETVTFAFEGSVAHHDSTGAGGVINPGDAQWMTAAGGILHKEYHEKNWAKTGGRFHMMQLWVNLPAKNKLDEPKYQPILEKDMGIKELEKGKVVVVAGEYQGVRGPASTYSPINLYTVKLDKNATMELSFSEQDNVMIFVMEGSIDANDAAVKAHSLILFNHEGTRINVVSNEKSHFMVLAGEPIREPVVSYGPFVMNTREEIHQANMDYMSGKFGYLKD